MLTAGVDPASAVQRMARASGVSVRTAQRYVKAAREELRDTVAEGADLVPSLSQVLANLQRIASEAASSGDWREANKALATAAVLIKAGLHFRRESDWMLENFRLARGSQIPDLPDAQPPANTDNTEPIPF